MNGLCVCGEELAERCIYKCGHALCPKCTLKLRVLMKDRNCPYCRLESPTVAVVDPSPSKKFEDAHIDLHRFGMFIETDALKHLVQHILNYPCPKCSKEQGGRKQLKDHIQKAHHLQLCDVCARNMTQFSEDYATYNSKQLASHQKKSHIRCKYCDYTFYSQEDFSRHCRKEHEYCFICERQDPMHPKYFPSYEKLRDHYQAEHFMCDVQSCIEDRHIVFGSKAELRNHMIEAHRDVIGPNVRQFQRLAVNDLGPQPTSVQQVDDDTPVPEESYLRRYEERLKILARQDPAKIEAVEKATTTFLTKLVPVAVFISTIETVLSGSTSDEVTALLEDFVRSVQLHDQKKRELSYALAQRSPKDLPKSGPKPQRVQPHAMLGGWNQQGARRPANQSIFDNLPRLESRRPPAYLTQPSPSSYRGHGWTSTSPSSSESHSAPSLRQTSTPMRQRRNGRGTVFEPFSPQQVERRAKAPPLEHSGYSAGAALSSQRPAPVDLSSLPSLPTRGGQPTQNLNQRKAGSKRVLRLV